MSWRRLLHTPNWSVTKTSCCPCPRRSPSASCSPSAASSPLAPPTKTALPTRCGSLCRTRSRLLTTISSSAIVSPILWRSLLKPCSQSLLLPQRSKTLLPRRPSNYLWLPPQSRSNTWYCRRRSSPASPPPWTL